MSCYSLVHHDDWKHHRSYVKAVVRELADVIAEPLSIIFERSWRTGQVPKDWRKANVTPVFKKGKKEDPGNYRPGQPHLHPRKGDGAAYPGGHHQASGGKEELSGVVSMDSPRGNHA